MIEIVAKVFGQSGATPILSIGGGRSQAMSAASVAASWRAHVSLDAGLHEFTGSCRPDLDRIHVLVRAADDIPRRAVPVAMGHPVQAVGAWPEHGIEGTRLGANMNGTHW